LGELGGSKTAAIPFADKLPRTLRRTHLQRFDSKRHAVEQVDPEVTAGLCHILSIEEIEQYPQQAPLCRFAQLLPEARQLASLGKVIPLNLAHSDTLVSVTNHSERAHSPNASSWPFPDLM